MRVIITGGTGVIGTHLARQLVADGHDVIILSRDPARRMHRIPDGAAALRWDGRTATGWAEQITADTVIVNLAGRNVANWRWTGEHKRRVLMSRVEAAQAVGAAVEAAPARPALVIQASAVGYYGDRGDDVLTEASAPGTGYLAEVCQAWEAAITPIMGDVRVAILRIGVVLSNDGGAFGAFRLATRLFATHLGRGLQYVPWLHESDMTNVIRFLLSDPTAAGVYNVVAPDALPNRELMGAIAEVLHWPTFVFVPTLALRIALGEQARAILVSQRVAPQNLLDAGYTFRFPDIDSAVRDLLKHEY